MKITLNEVKTAFAELIEGKKTREETANWAGLKANDYQHKTLEMESKEQEELIVAALFYLNGIDMKINDEEYLYSIEDVIGYKEENFL